MTRKIIVSNYPKLGLFKVISIVCFSIASAMILSLGINKYLIDKVANLNNGQQCALVMQAITTTIIFIGTSLYYLVCVERKSLSLFFQWHHPYSLIVTLVIGLILCSMLVASCMLHSNFFIIPPHVSSVREWLQRNEAIYSAAEAFLTTFNSFSNFLMGIVVMALLPAIGEEFFFRGIFQSLLHQIINNKHVAVIFSAFIFSAIHFRPYHFITILLFGILLGYMYVWSGNLLFSMIGHFFHNALVLTIRFLDVEKTLESTIHSASFKVLCLILIPVFILLFLFLYYFRRYGKLSVENPN